MNITVIGTGYVGLVTAACLADVGYRVCGLDSDREKIDLIRQGIMPIHEPGLSDIVVRTLREGHLRMTTEYVEAVADADVVFLAVGTPPDEDGSADLSHVLAAAREAARHVQRRCLFVTKSTVPVGTGDKVEGAIAEVLAERGDAPSCSVASNPEFLREGQAVSDFMKPDRIIAGVVCEEDAAIFQELYQPFSRVTNRLMIMDRPSAELAKYAANTMLATRISLMNELSQLCEATGADIESVRRGVGSDPRVGGQFLFAGVGYGGSCFPKDVQALAAIGREHGVAMEITEAVHRINLYQRQRFVERVVNAVEKLPKPCVALWGLAFKPKTDDMREAPSRELVEALLGRGVRVQAYDPAAMDVCREIWQGRDGVSFMDNPSACLDSADALVVVTEWMCFRNPNWQDVESRMRGRMLFDGRNLYEPVEMRERGWNYYGIGRGKG